jgi:hypothetical protein
MKKILIVLVTAASLLACKNNDKKTNGPSSPQGQKKDAKVDSANLTSIQWLDSTFKNHGKMKLGDAIDVTFRFKNTGTKNLVFSDVHASCGCTIPEKPEKPYAPGEEGVIKAKFDSKGKSKGEQRKEIYVTANTNPELTTLVFSVEITE